MLNEPFVSVLLKCSTTAKIFTKYFLTSFQYKTSLIPEEYPYATSLDFFFFRNHIYNVFNLYIEKDLHLLPVSEKIAVLCGPYSFNSYFKCSKKRTFEKYVDLKL